jgi:chemotaxis protein MotB
MSAEGEEGGGGHHGGWIVTYSDMITLLMTMFIVIVTFGSKDKDNYHKKTDSLVGGKGGTGAAGEQAKGADRNSVLVRVSPLGRPVLHGSEAAPVYSDPSTESIESVLKNLTEPPPGKLSDNFQLRLPIAFLFNGDALTEPGMRALKNLSEAVSDLPFDIQIQVGEAGNLPRGAHISQYLFQGCGIHPGRLGVAVRPAASGTQDAVWLILLRNR